MRQEEIKDASLAEIVRRLIDAYRPLRIYLFGSHARGEAGADSDYDLLLVVPDDASPRQKRSRLAYEVLRGTGVAADVIVWTKSNFNERLRVPASLPSTVEREGKELYAA
ncbi:MAG: nucleotidyltransferase domain-containing protein [Candidatus Binatia bacterium]